MELLLSYFPHLTDVQIKQFQDLQNLYEDNLFIGKKDLSLYYTYINIFFTIFLKIINNL